MASDPGFKAEQRSVALAMAGALVASIVILGVVAIAWRTDSLPLLSRLQRALRVDLLVVAWLAAAIANVARLRFFSEQDIAGSSAAAASDKVRVAGAILQNTFEQVGLAFATHLIVAATFSSSGAVIVALGCLFAIGRLLFWIGYKHGAKGRAFGFALTFYPNVLALLASAVATVIELAR